MAASSDSVWNARRERIHALLIDEHATTIDLKRELRRLLTYADSARRTMQHERAEIAHELQAMVAPFVAEVRRLRSTAAAAERAAGKGAPDVPPTIEGMLVGMAPGEEAGAAPLERAAMSVAGGGGLAGGGGAACGGGAHRDLGAGEGEALDVCHRADRREHGVVVVQRLACRTAPWALTHAAPVRSR